MMEEQLKKLKPEMLKGELAGFEFGAELKEKVVGSFEEKPRVSRFRLLIPATLSIVFLIIFGYGIYSVVLSHPSMNPGETLPGNEEPPVTETPDEEEPPATEILDEEKPNLIVPPYVPEGYVLKHTEVNDDVYEHLYVNEENEADYFAYIIRKEKPDYPFSGTPVKMADGLDGNFHKISEEHIFLTWQDEGMYQIVERKGSLAESEFYRIAEAILKAKGYEPTLDSMVKVEEPEPEVDFSEIEAVGLLEKYDSVREAAYQDAPDNYKFRSYKTKEEFYRLFVEFMSYGFVKNTFNDRLDEKADGLYIVPMDSVNKFRPANPYSMKKISDAEYQITQIQEGDMDGRQLLTFKFKNFEGIWKIDSIQTKLDSSPWLSQADAQTILGSYSEIQSKVFADASSDAEQKFKSYHTLEDINKEFREVASEEFLQSHLTGVVEEKPLGVYLVSSEEPARFIYKLRNDLARLNDTEYKLTQIQENNATFIATFKLVNGKWLINSLTITQPQ
jgi:hypothetical protein